MKAINSKYVLVEKLEKEKKEGFEAVEIQDSFVYKGKIKQLPECPIFVDNTQLIGGETVIFAKYSPDTHEIEKDKLVKAEDLLGIL